VAEGLEPRCRRFATLLHPTAIVADSAELGSRMIICPDAIVSEAVKLSRFVLLNYLSSLGLNASAGDFAVLVMAPYATLGGQAGVEANVFRRLHASVGPGRTSALDSITEPGSCGLYNTGPGSNVYGVPGRSAPRVSLAK
jgi:hypothetical protein